MKIRRRQRLHASWPKWTAHIVVIITARPSGAARSDTHAYKQHSQYSRAHTHNVDDLQISSATVCKESRDRYKDEAGRQRVCIKTRMQWSRSLSHVHRTYCTSVRLVTYTQQGRSGEHNNRQHAHACDTISLPHTVNEHFYPRLNITLHWLPQNILYCKVYASQVYELTLKKLH